MVKQYIQQSKVVRYASEFEFPKRKCPYDIRALDTTKICQATLLMFLRAVKLHEAEKYYISFSKNVLCINHKMHYAKISQRLQKMETNLCSWKHVIFFEGDSENNFGSGAQSEKNK